MADLIGISLVLIFIKMFIAIIFGYRARKQLAVVGIVNFVIYGALTLWIYFDIIRTNAGGLVGNGMLVFSVYFLGGLTVAPIVEVIVYMACLNKLAWEPREKRWQASLIAAAYTIVANAVSIFVIALFI